MTQWYEKSNIDGLNVSGKQLLEIEIDAMRDFQGDNAKLITLSDGRLCWLVTIRPLIPSSNKCEQCTMSGCKRRCKTPSVYAHGIRCREYQLGLVYDNDHPKVCYGSSIRAIPLKPTIYDLQEIVNRTVGISNKRIPHLIEENGELYLCSSDLNSVSANFGPKGLTSASTSLRYVIQWVNTFEQGLVDPHIWNEFQQEGKL